MWRFELCPPDPLPRPPVMATGAVNPLLGESSHNGAEGGAREEALAAEGFLSPRSQFLSFLPLMRGEWGEDSV